MLYAAADDESQFLARFGMPVLLSLVSGVLMWRFAMALNAVDRFNTDLRLVVASMAEAGGATDRPGGYGLANMRRRAQVIGGRLAIASGPGGTRIPLDLPRHDAVSPLILDSGAKLTTISAGWRPFGQGHRPAGDRRHRPRKIVSSTSSESGCVKCQCAGSI